MRPLGSLGCCLAAAFLIAVAGVPVAAQPAGTVLFVDADANGAADGASWADAFPDLRDALVTATAGDEVWVAEGTYLPAEGGVVDRDASFTLVSGTALFGGFDGTESDRDERDPETHVTVLSGDLGISDDISDNAFHVVVASGVDETTVLDGFTVTGGNGNGASPRNRGGGIYAENSSLVVRNCRIVANRVVQTDGFGGGGGAFFGSSGAPRFERVVFERNGLNGIGGGLWLLSDSERGSEVEMRWRFQTELSGDEIADVANPANAGALSAALRDVTFVENTGSFGGGMTADRAFIVVVRTDFVRNTVEFAGGGLNASQITGDLVNVGFYGNAGDPKEFISGGGGMRDSGSALTLTSVAFVGNIARLGGALSQGGGGTSTLTNVTFTANESPGEGGGVRVSSGSSVDLHNVVLWGNSDEIAVRSGAARLDHGLVEGGCPPEVACETLLDADPRFVRPPDPGSDGMWGTPDDDYGDLRLREGSPAVDFGLTSFLPPDAFDLDSDGDTTEPLPLDLAGEPRVVGESVDLGAYERPPTVASAPEPTASGVAFDVYPNPARGPVTVLVTLNGSKWSCVTLFNVLGQQVAVLHDGLLTAGTRILTMDTSALPAGVYLLRLQGDAMAFVRRIVVAR